MKMRKVNITEEKMNYIKAVPVNLLPFVVIGAVRLAVTSILKIWTVEISGTLYFSSGTLSITHTRHENNKMRRHVP